MRLLHDNSAGAYNVWVKCLACGKQSGLADMIVDTEGPAFQAYYHLACLPQEFKDRPVNCTDKHYCARKDIHT